MDQKYLTDSESLSLNIEAICLLLSSPRNFPYEIKMDKYRPYPSMISMFTSDSQHPPRSRHAVHLGVVSHILTVNKALQLPLACQSQLLSSAPLICLCSWVPYIANDMNPDQTAPQGNSLIRVHNVCFHPKI